jgi:hypothetical protein
MSRNYDSYKFLMSKGHLDFEYEARHYDVGTEESDGGKGTYQRWSVEDKHFHPQFQGTLTEFGWNHYYSSLSETEKQKFIEACNLRASTKNNNISDRHTDLRPMSELLSGLRGLYKT